MVAFETWGDEHLTLLEEMAQLNLLHSYAANLTKQYEKLSQLKPAKNFSKLGNVLLKASVDAYDATIDYLKTIEDNITYCPENKLEQYMTGAKAEAMAMGGGNLRENYLRRLRATVE